MEKGILSFLYTEFEKAVKYCNAEAEKAGDKENFDTDLIFPNFIDDVLSLSFYAISADDEVSPNEIKILNSLLEDFVMESLSIEEGREALKIVRGNPFEIPKTLMMFALRSYNKILDTHSDAKDKVFKEETDYLDTILCIYADLMCSTAETITKNEKRVIFECLQKCCDYISDLLHIRFVLSERVIAVVEK